MKNAIVLSDVLILRVDRYTCPLQTVDVNLLCSFKLATFKQKPKKKKEKKKKTKNLRHQIFCDIMIRIS